MWHQRVFGMQYAAKYNPDSLQLVCDDDVSFDANFVSDLYNNMCESEADAMIPYMFSSDSWALRVYNGILGNKYIIKREDYRVQICNTAGFAVSSSKKNLMLTQSGRFNIFMIKSCCIDKLSLEDEYWLDVTK